MKLYLYSDVLLATSGVRLCYFARGAEEMTVASLVAWGITTLDYLHFDGFQIRLRVVVSGLAVVELALVVEAVLLLTLFWNKLFLPGPLLKSM